MKIKKPKKISIRDMQIHSKKPYQLNQHAPVISNKKKEEKYKERDDEM